MPKTLLEIYNKYKVGDWPDKNSVHSYIPVYEAILEPYRYIASNVLEIGLMNGESLRMWTEYFGNHCNVFGMDCSETPVNGLADLKPIIAEGIHKIVIGDATKKEDVDKHFKDTKFQVIVDDGSHEISAQLKTIELFKNKMSKGGIMVLEDIQDIDSTRHLFKNIDVGERMGVVDLRNKKGRYDDVLILIHF